ncbi:hypothetical protein QBC42DRAFT_48807 [Cladorrhinum samala]|uniref:Uncharacterized protein n=1 Tax=Cladorrhinum samala TaxID=585594 RepID=A0AAV9HA58_9PEZI|nr:hypothetical protein QBC42DRAFT_48807 [Cladorrhinum samala]
MLVKTLLPAFMAVGSAMAQTPTATCSATGGQATINSQADAGQYSGCKKISGSIIIGPNAPGSIDLSGPSEITGDLKVLNNGIIERFSSSDLTTVGGAFEMKNVTKLISVNLPKLKSVKTLTWQSLTRLETIDLAVTKADEISVSDTFLKSLKGLDVTSIKKLDINNNRLLTTFTSSLGSLDDLLNIQANGIGLSVSLPNLVWIANMTIANVTSFSAPSLATVNGSARFDSNYFESFSAPNLTATQSGDISFVGNGKLSNVSFPVLERIGGGLLIANNTELSELTGFPKLKAIGGAVKLRGSFKEAAFPALEDVRGAFDISSTEDISGVCEVFDKQAPQNQGGNGNIQGTYSCTSNNSRANEDTSSTGSIGGGTKNDKKNGAVGMTLNTVLFALVGVAGFAVAL